MEVTQSTSKGGTPHLNHSVKNNNSGTSPRAVDRPNRKSFNSKSHVLSKRPASKPYRRQCDIYVSNKSNFKVRIF